MGTHTDLFKVTAVGMCVKAEEMKSLEGPSWMTVFIAMCTLLVIFLSGYVLGVMCAKRNRVRLHKGKGSVEPEKTCGQPQKLIDATVYVTRTGQCYHTSNFPQIFGREVRELRKCRTCCVMHLPIGQESKKM